MVSGIWIRLGAAAVIAGASLAFLLLRGKKSRASPEPGRKRRASYDEADGITERTSKRREVEELNIFAAAAAGPAVGLPAAMAGSVPDMTASWLAKTAVSAEQQADARQLAAAYEGMARELGAHGLNLPAIAAQRQFYRDLDAERPTPLAYADFGVPLERGAVRLAVLLPPRRVRDAAVRATRAVEAVLPAGMKPHATPADSLHITLFMTSQPADPRPDPFSAFGGQSVAFPLGGPPASIPAAAPGVLAAEQRAFAALAANTSAPTLEVHSVVFATSGTLLLCCVDTSGVLAGLRKRMRTAFIGGAAKQSSIFHVTLLRVLEPQQLSAEQIAAIQTACAKQTDAMRGMCFRPASMWHIQEWQFTTVQGERMEMPFAAAGQDNVPIV